MRLHFKKFPLAAVAMSALSLVLASSASAHVTVKPGEVVTAGFQTFTISVPNEKTVPTTSIKVLIPSNLKSVTPTQKPGWQVSTDKDGSGEDALVRSITWSGGSIADGLRDEFTFAAQVPEKATEIQWKAYQTYADGSVVSWDKADDAEKADSGPFSVTKVVADSEQDVTIKKAEQAAADASAAANRSFYLAVAGVVLGLVAIFLSTRKRS